MVVRRAFNLRTIVINLYYTTSLSVYYDEYRRQGAPATSGVFKRDMSSGCNSAVIDNFPIRNSKLY